MKSGLQHEKYSVKHVDINRIVPLSPRLQIWLQVNNHTSSARLENVLHQCVGGAEQSQITCNNLMLQHEEAAQNKLCDILLFFS